MVRSSGICLVILAAAVSPAGAQQVEPITLGEPELSQIMSLLGEVKYSQAAPIIAILQRKEQQAQADALVHQPVPPRPPTIRGAKP